MPIYEFKCDTCGAEMDVIRSFSDAGDVLECECGQLMSRKFSLPACFIMPQTGRDKVLATLNREGNGFTYPGGEMYGARYDQAMAKGLERHGQPGMYRSGVSATSRKR